MSTYARLAMVACKSPRSVRVVLTGNERAIRVTDLGGEEWLDVELGTNGVAQHRSRLSSNGEHLIPPGFGWIVVTKGGQGSPTTVELLHDV